MVFASNPLALSVPEPAFESWLRDSGYLEVLDHKTSSALSSSSAAAGDPTSSATTSSPAAGFFLSLVSSLGTLLSLLTLNPLAKLATDDFTGDTPSWSRAFVGSCGSYSFPSSSAQARLRVHENVKRYARNYAYLFILFFACALYVFFLGTLCAVCLESLVLLVVVGRIGTLVLKGPKFGFFLFFFF